MISGRKKVLYIVHGHPDLSPGGGELAAYYLYQAMRASAEYEPYLLFRVEDRHAFEFGYPINRYGDDDHVYQFSCALGEYDFFQASGVNGDLRSVGHHLTALKDFLIALQPDIVHFQHFLFIGIEAVSLVRRFVPHAKIVMTLHEFLPICPNSGAMLKNGRNELCFEAKPAACGACFPQYPPWQIFLRERHMRANLALVDKFITPSRFLRERFIAWGIAPDRIVMIENGRPPWPHSSRPSGAHNPFVAGFIGQIVFHKGLEIYLRAAAEYLRRRADDDELPELRFAVHGTFGSLPPELVREIEELKEKTKSIVTFFGAYSRFQLPLLLGGIDCIVVPSRWWENSPLVIQEASMACVPVVCSNIGGMAEKVSDGVSGLHFNVGDHFDLLHNLLQLARDPQLYERLVAGIRPVFSDQEMSAAVHEIYREARALVDEPAAVSE